MKKCILLLTPPLLIFLSLALFSCGSGQSSPALTTPTPTIPFTVPTPFVLDEILPSLQFSPTNSPLCPNEDYYRSLPEDYYSKKWESWIANPPTSSGGTMGLISVSDGILLALNTYEVPEQKTITATIRYYYLGTGPGDTAPRSMRFILLLDEQQVTTKFDDVVQPYYDVIIHPGDDGAITFDVPPLQPGIHDLNLVGFPDVDQEPNYLGVDAFFTYRFTLVSGGENSLLPRPYSHFRAGNRSWFKREVDNFWPGLAVSLEKNEMLDWNYPNPLLPVPLGKPLDFYLFAGYEDTGFGDYPDIPNAKEQPFALIILDDYQQSAISSETPVIYGIVSNTTAWTRIPVHYFPSQAPGSHQIVVVRITYPGFPACLLSIDERIYPDQLDFSRVWYEIVP
jgi:hypothetical protein